MYFRAITSCTGCHWKFAARVLKLGMRVHTYQLSALETHRGVLSLGLFGNCGWSFQNHLWD